MTTVPSGHVHCPGYAKGKLTSGCGELQCTGVGGCAPHRPQPGRLFLGREFLGGDTSAGCTPYEFRSTPTLSSRATGREGDGWAKKQGKKTEVGGTRPPCGTVGQERLRNNKPAAPVQAGPLPSQSTGAAEHRALGCWPPTDSALQSELP